MVTRQEYKEIIQHMANDAVRKGKEEDLEKEEVVDLFMDEFKKDDRVESVDGQIFSEAMVNASLEHGYEEGYTSSSDRGEN